MESLLGKVSKGKVIDENDQFYFVQLEDVKTYRLDKKEIKKPLKQGSFFSGFAYENVNHELQITREAPDIRVGRFGWAKVVRVRRDLGVFVDIGLPNKDMVVSLDELSTENRLWPNMGDRLFVCITVDNKNRMWAKLADDSVFRALAQRANTAMTNKNVSATAYRLKIVGTIVFTDDFYVGFIHPSERNEEPRLGEQLTARVIKVQQDGSLNLSLKPRGYEAIGDDAAMVLALLEHSSEHSLNLNDHSDPVEIKKTLGISKGQFKRALGHLLKAGIINQTDEGIELKSED